MTVEDKTVEKPEGQQPVVKAEAAYKTPEDEAYEAAQRALEEAEQAAQEADPKGGEDKAEAKEFAQVADEAADAKNEAANTETFDEEGDKEGKTVPLAVLMKERKVSRERERELELEIARRDGALSVIKSAPENAGEPAAPEKSPQELIADLETQISTVWRQADEGEMSLQEVNQKAREIQRQINDLERNTSQQAQDNQPVVMDVRIEENLVELERKYPVITVLTEQQMAGFVQAAYQQAEEDGKPIGRGAMETMRLHNMAAKAAYDHYGQFYQAPQTANTISAQPSPTGQPSAPQGLSPAAQARAAKMDLAAGHPPDINKIGSAAEGTLNDAQVLAKLEGLSEEERIEFLETMPGLAKRLGA